MQEVIGSIPIVSTKSPEIARFWGFLTTMREKLRVVALLTTARKYGIMCTKKAERLRYEGEKT